MADQPLDYEQYASGDADGEIVITSPFGRTLHSRAGPMAA
jgi:hypothetical protein